MDDQVDGAIALVTLIAPLPKLWSFNVSYADFADRRLSVNLRNKQQLVSLAVYR